MDAFFFFTFRRFFFAFGLLGGTSSNAFNASANFSGWSMTGFAGGIVSGPFSAEAQTTLTVSAWRPPLPEAPRAMEDASACCDHALEYVGMLPVVMPEGEFVEVEREVVFRDVMERAHDAPLNERPEAINVRGMDFPAHVLASAMADKLVGPSILNPLIPPMLVCGNQINALRDRLMDEPIQCEHIGTLDHLRHDVALTGDGAEDSNLSGAAASALSFGDALADSAPMPVLGFPADVGFINLDHAGQLLEFLILHGRSDTVTHIPGRPVGTRADGTLNLQGAHPLLTLAHEVDYLEPDVERVVGVLEDRSHQRREAVALLATLLALPRPGTGELMNLRVLTARACDAIRPAQLNQVAFAGVLGGEPRIQLCECHHG
jgi:hypothetical protein